MQDSKDLIGLLIWKGIRILIHLEGKPTDKAKKILNGIVNNPESIKNLYFAFEDTVVLISENHQPIPTRTGGETHLIPAFISDNLVKIARDLREGFVSHQEFLQKASSIGFSLSLLNERSSPYVPSLIFPNHPNPLDIAFKLLQIRGDLGMPVRFIHLKEKDFLLVYKGEKIKPHNEFFDLDKMDRFPELTGPKAVGCTNKACYIVDIENVQVIESEVFLPEDYEKMFLPKTIEL